MRGAGSRLGVQPTTPSSPNHLYPPPLFDIQSRPHLHSHRYTSPIRWSYLPPSIYRHQPIVDLTRRHVIDLPPSTSRPAVKRPGCTTIPRGLPTGRRKQSGGADVRDNVGPNVVSAMYMLGLVCRLQAIPTGRCPEIKHVAYRNLSPTRHALVASVTTI